MFLLLGVAVMLAAGAIIVEPFADDSEEDGANTREPDDLEVAGSPEAGSSLLDTFSETEDQGEDTPDETGTDETGTEDTDTAEPDPVDQVYGQNMGDALGGNLFDRLLFQTHAITGGAGPDALQGGSGADLMVGNEGDDSLSGGNNTDMLIGDTGDDTLDGGDGTDILDAGDGDDLALGGAGNDLLTGGEGNDDLQGGAGDDQIFGQLGQDTLSGGLGNDFLDGTHAATTVAAWIDQDDEDLLTGGDGDDTIVLGSGDIAVGGDGEDTFAFGIYDEANPLPQITDFDVESDDLEILFDTANGSVSSVTTEVVEGTLLVHVNGQAVVALPGVESIDPSLIRVVPIH